MCEAFKMHYFVIDDLGKLDEIPARDAPDFHEFRLDDPAFFPELPEWERFVLGVLKQFQDDGYDEISYALLHRYSVPWWKSRESVMYWEMLRHILTLGFVKISRPPGYYIWLWLAGGHSPRFIYAQMNSAISALIEKKLCVHTVRTTRNGETHFYALAPCSQSRI